MSLRTFTAGALLGVLSLALACGAERPDDDVDAGGAPGTETAPDAGDPADAGEARPDAGEVPVRGAALAEGLEIRDVTLYQAVKIPLVEAGAAVSSALPIVAGRQGIVEVRATVGAAAIPGPVRVELLLGNPSVPVAGATVQASAGGVVETTLPFAAASVAADARWSIRILREGAPLVADGVAHAARWPRSGEGQALGAHVDGGVRVVLVPFRYDTDGSGRLPDTSPATLSAFEALVGAMYPLSQVTLTVRAPVGWNRSKTLTGNVRFGSMNDDLTALRQADGAAEDVYYYGLVKPAATYGAYCGGSCVTGQGYVADLEDADLRVGSGVAFDPEDAAGTFAHELGHMHGRSHAPCGTTGADADYPYRGGSIGVTGWDRRDGSHPDATTAKDFMGYCEPAWVSDYTYGALFERIHALNLRVGRLGSPPTREVVRVLSLVPGEPPSFGRALRLPPNVGRPVPATWLDARGRALGPARVREAPSADGEERSLYVPAAPRRATSLRVDADALVVPVR